MIVRQSGELKVKGAAQHDASLDASRKVILNARESLIHKGEALLDGLLEKSGSTRRPFILLVDNDEASASAIVAACQQKKTCVLIPLPKKKDLLPYVVRETGINLFVDPQAKLTTDLPCDKKSPVPWLTDSTSEEGGVCMLTSGSTGLPKIVFCSWTSMLVQGTATYQRLFPNGPCRFVCASSIAHAYAINALFAIYTSPFGANSELFLDMDSFVPQADSSSDKPTILFGTPGTYSRLSASSHSVSLHNIQAFSAGVALPPALHESLKIRFGLHVLQNYGATETGGICVEDVNASRYVGISRPNLQAVGLPWPGVQVRVDVPSCGRLCCPDERGEIAVLTPWQCMGYVQQMMLIPISRDGFYYTGDGGYVDDDNLVFVGQRLRDPVRFRYQGFDLFVPPQQVEAALLKNPSVSDVLVPLVLDDLDDKSTPKKPIALVVAPSTDEMALRKWCAENLPPILADIEIHLVEFLPCSPAGKLMYSITKQ
ncbi:unnamed protein product [Aphanomyces euteiches]|uniref:AMP-dependent synthetase/ligase domain-containing protein n=1 Tax=Aphanomyces euteiches TaxID=100861 RepID=A0A6G0WWV1_9STRA|nr:hypothetical protein Ae201684_010925 [Aphanomyces euteiches]KAH9061681.1 hypothetical protein Ae201684P_021016 [Aphanomyces euteiches]KAH9157470.1 hypothetical protein AeRB84_000669 [Aphanomyces euteiches]